MIYVNTSNIDKVSILFRYNKIWDFIYFRICMIFNS